MANFSLRNFIASGRAVFILICAFIITLSLFLANNISRELRMKEVNDIRLWAMAESQLRNDINRDYEESFKMLATNVISNNNSIPTIMTDGSLNVISYHNIPRRAAKDPKKLNKLIERMARNNDPIVVNTQRGTTTYIFYQDSPTLIMLNVFPYIQLSIIVIFIFFSYVTMRSSRNSQQDRVWVGMAKETAHQLGSPTSSLLGWLEYLKTQDIDPTVIEEMNKDINRLLKVIDRFSKIGATTQLEPRNVMETISGTVSYFSARLPKYTTLEYINNANNPLQALINDALFDWVIENLIKNAIDAVQGKGKITITTYDDDKNIYIDVTDTGKGMAKSNFDKIFKPGFTTKTRGWGLGLSLSKRIIEEYHRGKIYVAHSEIDKGTTIRIELKRL